MYLLEVSFKYGLITLTNYIGVPNSVNILYHSFSPVSDECRIPGQ
jgi:hypothetical protein